MSQDKGNFDEGPHIGSGNSFEIALFAQLHGVTEDQARLLLNNDNVHEATEREPDDLRQRH